MRINGFWFAGDDGVSRPVVLLRTPDVHGSKIKDRFLIDTGADRTVLSGEFLGRLGIAGAIPVDTVLEGVGGIQGHVLVSIALEARREDGEYAVISGEFAAFTDLSATDMSILGRDVLNHFDVIVSRPRGEVVLLTAPHAYHVEVTPSPA